ncbi:hypothetical protein [Vibrio sp. R78045]|uniref:hypothetical protein n=1 Tax=Vibrio sp. R78045 TaxID=3093868 RepID=UPI0036F3E96B
MEVPPPLNVEIAPLSQLKKGVRVKIRYFFKDVYPDHRGEVHKVQNINGRDYVRVITGRDRRTNKPRIKQFPLSAIALDESVQPNMSQKGV